MKKPLIILAGPTAVGKTELSIALAKKVGGEIISADSMQVYKHMNIGSAKIMPDQMQGIRHYLIDELEPDEEFNVVRFQKMAKEALQNAYKNGKIPILVGGTGFYIQAVLYDIDFTDNDTEDNYREELERLLAKEGASYLHRLLQKEDPKAAESIHENNTKRVIRALEFKKQTGKLISEHNEAEKRKQSPYQFAYFVLNEDRQELYCKIDRRIDTMIENGLLEEVKKLSAMGYHKNMVSMQGLGYKELLTFLNQEITFEEAVYILKRDTRHFAKRQLTWFRREKDVIWLEKDKFDNNPSKMLDYMLETIKQKEIFVEMKE